MRNSIKARLEKLEKEKGNGVNKRKRSALILCDRELPQGFKDFKVDADAVLILPDNGRRGLGKTAPKGGYSVYYSSY